MPYLISLALNFSKTLFPSQRYSALYVGQIILAFFAAKIGTAQTNDSQRFTPQRPENAEVPVTQLSRPAASAPAKAFREYADSLFWSIATPQKRFDDFTADAFAAYKEAADRGDVRSLVFVGRCLMRGEGTAKNIEAAETALRQASAGGDPLGDFYLAALFEDEMKNPTTANEKYKSALPKLTNAARNGDAWCQYSLGYIYYFGKSVSVDYSNAMQYFAEAQQNGHPIAPFYLATGYEDGRGIERDAVKAFENYKISATFGDAEAQLRLGNCYYFGQGTAKNYAAAARWYRLSSESKVIIATYILGHCYEFGQGVDVDIGMAIWLYRDAADKGNPDACASLASIYFGGKGVPADDEKLASYGRKAAELGSRFGMRLFGYALLYGRGVTVNQAAGRDWLEKAIKGGDTKAQEILASFDEQQVRAAQAKLERIAQRRGAIPLEMETLEREIEKLLAEIEYGKRLLAQLDATATQGLNNLSTEDGVFTFKNFLNSAAVGGAAYQIHEIQNAIRSHQHLVERKRTELRQLRTELLELGR